MSHKKYVRIRSVDVGRPKHHYIKIGVTKKGKTERIGGLRLYKGKGGWFGEPKRHSEAAVKGQQERTKKEIKKLKQREWYWRWRHGKKVKSYQDLSRDRKFLATHKRKRIQPTWVGDLPHSRI
jgi:hypothetical protein